MIEAKCETCKGTGRLYGDMAGPCPTCGGSGKWPREVPKIPQAKPSVRTYRQEDWSQEITGERWPSMNLDGDKIWAAFEKTKTRKEIISFRDAIDAVLPTHPAFIRMRRQRNICFWLAVALAIWMALSLVLLSKLMERLL